MSIATELTKLSNTKLDIKHAIQDKGVIVHDEDTFDTYADKIENIAGYGENIDISKVNYQIGSGYIGEYTGRILRGFSDMGSKCAFPVIDINNTDMGVPWNDSFEIGIGFKFIAFPTYQSLFGDGNYNSYRRGARIYYSNNDNDFWLCVSGDGSTLMVDAMLGFTPQLDTWYFIKLRFVKSTMKLTVDITEDFETYTNLYDNTLSTPPYYDSSTYLAIGGEARASEMASNTFLVDTFNTYVKDNTNEIVWGTFAGRFGNGEFPISGIDSLNPFGRFSITSKILTSAPVSGGFVPVTRTYTVDEDGFYLSGYSTWSNANQTSSITYSNGNYIEYGTGTDRGETKISIAYLEAGTTITLSWMEFWDGLYFVYKLNGIRDIGNEVFVGSMNGQSGPLNIPITNLSQDKKMLLFYHINAGDRGQCNIEFYPETYEQPSDYRQIIVTDNNRQMWNSRLGFIFLDANSNLGGITTRYISGGYDCASIFYIIEVS